MRARNYRSHPLFLTLFYLPQLLMSIQYPPKPGEILICTFQSADKGALNGFVVPEMIKKRPVVVLSSKSYKLCLVVALSTTPPRPVRDWHYEINWEAPLPQPFDSEISCWAKGDHIYAVSYERLNQFYAGKDYSGKRIYERRYLSADQLLGVRDGVRSAIG